MQVAVIGAGGWGTALALLLTFAGRQVRLWVRRSALCEQLRKERENALYLPGVTLPAQLELTSSLADAAMDAQLIVLAVPSHALRAIAHELDSVLHGVPIIVSATKGIEENSLLTMSTVLSNVLSKERGENIAVLSGPSFAAEVARQLPTAVTVAAKREELASTVQQTFSTSRFRVYTTTDVLGVEIGGAVKNVIAIAAGVSDGLGYGHSARAAVITRGLVEMKRLAVRLGAESQTLSGLSGMGDLILTCTSNLSRNYRVGVRLAQGEAITNILQSTSMVAEGVRTSHSVFALAHRLAVEMPIVTQVYKLLYEEKPPQQVVADLLTRAMKPEFS
jgi:glycerol-3-phosphate dehydrogenase (NAD(P)+)